MNPIDQINHDKEFFYNLHHFEPSRIYLGAKEMEALLSNIAEFMKKPKELLDKDGEMCIFGMEIIEVARINYFNITI